MLPIAMVQPIVLKTGIDANLDSVIEILVFPTGPTGMLPTVGCPFLRKMRHRRLCR
jgi:hypothetical protein